MNHWGSYRDDESIHKFQRAIKRTKPPLHLATEYDAQLANAMVADKDVWTRNIHNPVHNTTPQHPLRNPITIQILHAAHFTTRKPNNNKYFYYDNLRLPISSPVYKLHANLRSWYTHTLLPPSLTPELPNTSAPYTPQQQDGWSYAPHMLIVSISAIYQGTISILPYSQRHANQLSRMLLEYVIMGELIPRIDKIITNLSGHVNNADLEPFNEHYNAGGTVLFRQHLEQNRKKTRPKTQPLPRP